MNNDVSSVVTGEYLITGDDNLLLEESPASVLVSSAILNGNTLTAINRRGSDVTIGCQGNVYEFLVDSAGPTPTFVLPNGKMAFFMVAWDGTDATTRIFVSTNYASGAGGFASMATLTDIDYGVGSELAVGDIVMVYSGNADDGFRWTNIPLAPTIQSNVNAIVPPMITDAINTMRPVMDNIAPAADPSPTPLEVINNLIAELIDKGYMAAPV